VMRKRRARRTPTADKIKIGKFHNNARFEPRNVTRTRRRRRETDCGFEALDG
jgi:hypothetical protein